MRRLLIVSALCLSLLGFAPPEAHATLDNNLCDKNELCVWENPSMTGCFRDFGDGEFSGQLHQETYDTCPQTSIDNSISSFFNNSELAVVFMTEREYKGKRYCAYPNSSSPRIHSDWNENISSVFVAAGYNFESNRPEEKCTVRKKNQG